MQQFASFFASYVRELASLPATSAPERSEGDAGSRTELHLSGRDNPWNVFQLDADSLAYAHTLRISAAPTSTVLIVQRGEHVELTTKAMLLDGVGASNVLFVFPDATSLDVAAMTVEGSIIAPFAAMTQNNGTINGQVLCAAANGVGQLNWVPFKGHTPPSCQGSACWQEHPPL